MNTSNTERYRRRIRNSDIPIKIDKGLKRNIYILKQQMTF
jgi:hypothetical protein